MKKLLNYFLNKKWILSVVTCFLSDEKKEKIQIEILRNEFLYFNYDTSNISDDEIKKGVKNFAQSIGNFGITAEELSQALCILSNCT